MSAIGTNNRQGADLPTLIVPRCRHIRPVASGNSASLGHPGLQVGDKKSQGHRSRNMASRSIFAFAVSRLICIGPWGKFRHGQPREKRHEHRAVPAATAFRQRKGRRSIADTSVRKIFRKRTTISNRRFTFKISVLPLFHNAEGDSRTR